jgi:repressor of nif and glnA expression
MRPYIIVFIFLLIVAASATRYPGGTVVGDLNMLGHNLLNAGNLENNSTQLLSDLGNATARIDLLEGNDSAQDISIGDLLANVSPLQLDLANVTANVTQLQSDTGNITENVTLLQGYEGDDAQDIYVLQNTQSYLNVIAGGSPGNLTLTGIRVGDALNGVLYLDNASPSQFSDLGDEFGIIDNDTIANDAINGTDTTNGFIIVSWSQYEPPE